MTNDMHPLPKVIEYPDKNNAYNNGVVNGYYGTTPLFPTYSEDYKAGYKQGNQDLQDALFTNFLLYGGED